MRPHGHHGRGGPAGAAIPRFEDGCINLQGTIGADDRRAGRQRHHGRGGRPAVRRDGQLPQRLPVCRIKTCLGDLTPRVPKRPPPPPAIHAPRVVAATGARACTGSRRPRNRRRGARSWGRLLRPPKGRPGRRVQRTPVGRRWALYSRAGAPMLCRAAGAVGRRWRRCPRRPLASGDPNELPKGPRILSHAWWRPKPRSLHRKKLDRSRSGSVSAPTPCKADALKAGGDLLPAWPWYLYPRLGARSAVAGGLPHHQGRVGAGRGHRLRAGPPHRGGVGGLQPLAGQRLQVTLI